MAQGVGFYSRFISWVKIVLPVAALGLLSSVFLLARNVQISDEVPFAVGSISNESDRQRLRSPVFTSVTEDGDAVEIIAGSAEQTDDPNIYLADDLITTIQDKTGETTQLTARKARLSQADEQGWFQGDVVISDPDGRVLSTDELFADLATEAAIAPTAVTITGDFGQLDAGAMEILPREGRGDAPRFLFTEGVRVLYLPSSEVGD